MSLFKEGQKIERLVKIIQDLIKFDTQNPPNHTSPCLEYISNLLLEHDIKYNILKDPEGGSHLYAEINCYKGISNENEKKGPYSSQSLLMINHIDVPNLSFIQDPLESTLNYDWKYPCTSAMVINNSIYGLGSYYSKSNAAAQLFTILEMKKQETDSKGNKGNKTDSTESKHYFKIKLLSLSNGIPEYQRLRKDANFLNSLRKMVDNNSSLLKSDYTITPYGGYELPEIKGLVEKTKRAFFPVFGMKAVNNPVKDENDEEETKTINNKIFTISVGNKSQFNTRINLASSNVSSVNYMEMDNIIHLFASFLNNIKDYHYKVEIKDYFKEFVKILPANQVLKGLLTSKLLPNAMRNPNSSLYTVRTLCSPTVSPVSVNSNMNPTQLDASTPNYMEAELDIRLLPGSELQDAENLISRFTNDLLKQKMNHKIVSHQIGNESSIDTSLYRAIQRLMREQYNSEIIPIINPYLDYSILFREIGSQTFGFSPRIIEPNANYDLFGRAKNLTNEQISIQNLILQTEFYLKLISENFLVE